MILGKDNRGGKAAEVPGKTNGECNAILKGGLLWRTRSQIESNLARD
jgi:hypothetical protein